MLYPHVMGILIFLAATVIRCEAPLPANLPAELLQLFIKRRIAVESNPQPDDEARWNTTCVEGVIEGAIDEIGCLTITCFCRPAALSWITVGARRNLTACRRGKPKAVVMMDIARMQGDQILNFSLWEYCMTFGFDVSAVSGYTGWFSWWDWNAHQLINDICQRVRTSGWFMIRCQACAPMTCRIIFYN